jgi:hypothetical protein
VFSLCAFTGCALCSAFDTDGNGQVDYREFQTMIESLRVREQAQEQPKPATKPAAAAAAHGH